MKKFVNSLMLSFLLGSITPVHADNANPPKIISVEQVTSGPYSVGDIVTFKVNYTGGFPGIQNIRISINCVSNSHSTVRVVGGLIGWANIEKTTTYSGNGLVSGFVTPCNQPEVQPTFVEIADQTNLRASINWEELKQNSSLKVQINKSDLLPTPVGEIKPSKLPDELDLGIASKIQVNQTFNLPRLTKAGAPIIYTVMTRRNCQINWDTFLGDIGGKLTATSAGICAIRVSSQPSDKYENPLIKTDKVIKPGKSSSVILSLNVIKSSKK